MATTKDKTQKQVSREGLQEQHVEFNVQQTTWKELTWLHIERPTNRETEYLAKRYPFHPLNLDDMFSRIQRPKIDDYKDHSFIVLHFPVFNPVTRVITSSEMDIFIGEDYIVTVDCVGNLKTLSKFFRLCQTSEEAREDNFSHGSGYLVYRLIDRLVDYCLPIVDKIIDQVEQIEDTMFENKRGVTIREISILRHNIISIRRIIWPGRAVISCLEAKIQRFTDIVLEAYFGDLIDHMEKIWDAIEEYKEIIEGLNATHDSLASDRTNEVLRVLTILATIGTVLTVVFSFYGMNVPMPGGGSEGDPKTWIILILVMVVIITGMLFYFKRKRYL
ncbi:magnesium transporter CorA family protein [Chloroflexota bacterium]